MPEENNNSIPAPPPGFVPVQQPPTIPPPPPGFVPLNQSADDQRQSSDEAAQRSEEYKRTAYAQAHTDFSAGNYRKAASDLLKLADNPDEPSISDIGKGFLKAGAETLFALGKA